MSADPKILDRLKKLLELADRGDEHEATVAAERAAELMAKHGVEAAEVHARAGDKPTIAHFRVDAELESDDFSRCEAWHKCLAGSIADVLGCASYNRGRGKAWKLMMVGRPDAAATARYMYLHMETQIKRLARDAMRRESETQNAWRRAYCLGVVARIYNRMLDAKKAVEVTSMALVFVGREKAMIDAELSTMVLRDPRKVAGKRPDAKGVGWSDGASVDLGRDDAARIGEGQRKLR